MAVCDSLLSMKRMKASAASLLGLLSNSTISSPPTTEMLPPGPAGKFARPYLRSGYWALKMGGIQGPSTISDTVPLPSSSLVELPLPRMVGEI
jgi:hypothetical protein